VSDIVTYTVDNETITFSYPILTVTQVPVLAGRGDFTIAVRKIYAVRSIVYLGGFSSLDAAISWLHQILSTPGGKLSIQYADWGNELNIDPETYPDLRGGPRPRAVNITKIYGSRAAMVHWEVEVELFPTPAGYSGEISKWVDLVYTINTTIDKDLYATRRIGGILRINKYYSAQEGFSVDSFRTTISNYFRLPDNTRGYWERISQNYTTSEDDTVLKFEIIDKQVYSWLPQHITSGDLSITTSVTRSDQMGVVSSLSLSGFFQSTDFSSRQRVHNAVIEVINLFALRVLAVMQQEAAGGSDRFWIREKAFDFTHYWRANRVDFNLTWQVFGMFEGELHVNSTYTTELVMNWLSALSAEVSTPPKESEEFGISPYGTSLAAGVTGKDYIASPIEINFEEKIAASRSPGYWNIPEYGERTEDSQGGRPATVSETTESTDNITFHQNFEFKVDTGVRSLSLLSEGYNDALQQVHNPRVYLIITGEAERWDAPPLVPRPPYPLIESNSPGGGQIGDPPAPKAALLSADIKAREPTGDGKYKLEWQYIVLLQDVVVPPNLDLTSLSLRWPWTPNYPDKTWSGDEYRKWEDWTFPQ